ncbi:hypothetical protein PS870_04516 [Pseudomonas fluorescens]|uniref:Uncharacterized protein n=1 Tax=Pseudomonas fluorescens TaxID=294 RepID=A0A5E7NGA1_PSEFL|nr:hypothetical protein [Pseudomonas fluorescens]VVP34953.1 hypothetical protein PS870_04516 [Pseudomonas fluorescens]
MIGVPMPNPRDSIIAELNEKMDHFFGAGKKVEEIPPGISADVPMFGATPHSLKLRAARDKDAPRLQELADAGKTVVEAAKEMSMLAKRARLIARENNIKFAEPS